MKRRLNAKLLAGLVVAGLGGGAAIHAWHGHQVRRTAGALLEQAAAEEKSGREVAAVEALRHYISLRPDDVDALVRLVLILERSARSPADRGKVLEAFEQVLRRDPGRRDVRLKLVRLAMEPDLRRYDQAASHLRILLAESPADGELEGRLGLCEEEASRFPEAAGLYERAIAHEPGRLEPYGRLAALLRDRLDDPAKAERVADQAVASNPESFRAHLMRAEFRERSAPALAAEDVARAASLAPDEADVILASAATEPDAEKSRAILDRGLAKHPGDSRLYRRLAGLELTADRSEAAMAVVDRGLAALPDDPDLRIARADALIQAGRRDEASRELERLRQEGFPTPPLDLMTARIAVSAGLWREAADTLERLSTALDTVNLAARAGLAIEANLRLAECYDRLGRPELRLAAYRRVLALDPRHRAARMGQAATLAQLGRADEALAASRELAAEWPRANLEVARLWIGRNRGLPESARRWEEAEKALARAEQAAPGSLACALVRAELEAGRGRFAEAGERLARAVQEHPGRVEPWLGRADLVERDGGPTAALAVLDEAQSRLGDRAEIRLARADRLGRVADAPARAALDRLEDGLDNFPGEERDGLTVGLAEVRHRIGDRDGARRLWDQAASRRPWDVDVRARLFDLALTDGDLEDAGRRIDSLRQAEGPDGGLWRYAEASLALARARAGRGAAEGLAEARARLAEAAARRPTWPRVAVLEGEIAEQLGERDRAVEAYRRAFDLGERDPQVVGKLAGMMMEAGQVQEAGAVLRSGANAGVLVGAAARVSAELALREGDPARAREAARRAVPDDAASPADLVWLGETLERAGEVDEAGAALRKAVDRSRDRPEPWLALVRHLARNGRREEAARTAREAEAALGAEAAGPALALCDEAVGDLGGAERRHRRAVAAGPDDGEAVLAFGEFLDRTGRFQEALPVLRRAAALLDGRPAEADRARRALATALIATPEYRARREAVGLLDRNLQRGGTVEDRRLRALALAARGDAAVEAIRAFEELARVRPLGPEERLIAARLRESSGDRAVALAGFQAAARDRPGDPAALASLAEAQLNRGDLDAARATADLLEAAEPNAYRAAELRARLLAAGGDASRATERLLEESRKPEAPAARISALLESWGRLAEAEAVLRERGSRATRPEDALALARFLARRDRASEALDACEGAWEGGAPEEVATACLAAASARSAGDAELRRALAQVEAAASRAPNSNAFLIRWALLHERNGDAARAEALYRRALDRDPENPVVLNNLANLLAMQGDRVAEAMSLVDRASAQVGEPAELLDTRAVAFLAAKSPDQAIRSLEASLALRPSPEGHFRLARAQAMGRRFDDARRSLRKARELGFDPRSLTPLERPSLRALEEELAQNPPQADGRATSR